MDKGFLKLLQEKTGLNISWADFVVIYKERKAQRDKDPVIIARRKFNHEVFSMMTINEAIVRLLT